MDIFGDHLDSNNSNNGWIITFSAAGALVLIVVSICDSNNIVVSKAYSAYFHNKDLIRCHRFFLFVFGN